MTEQAYKNIYRIYVPLTGNPLKSLNSYLIKAEGTGKNLLIDTGFNCEECLEALLAGMAELGATVRTRMFSSPICIPTTAAMPPRSRSSA